VPVRLFTDTERERLNRFPRDISPADLLAFFTPSVIVVAITTVSALDSS